MEELSLKKYFADLNVLLYITLNFHWNVTGGLFLTLHELYNKQYNFIFTSIDQLAEILKRKNIYPLTTFNDINELSNIKTMESRDYTARESLEYLVKLFELFNKEAIKLGNQAEKEVKLTLADFFTQQSNFFNKQLYFLQQFLK